MKDPRGSVTVSVVATAFNERENLKALCDEIRSTLEPTHRDFEIIIVDNGSSDGSLALLKSLRNEDPRIGYVSLSRNFGHQGGLIAGLEHARGDVVVSMDADLQHPPPVIAELLAHWENGYEVVGTIRESAGGTSLPRRILNRAFYAGIRSLMGSQLQGDGAMGSQSDFRLMDRRALDALLSLPEKDKFLRGLASWIGFRQTAVPYLPRERRAGRSKFALAHLVAFSINGVAAFSILPLRLFTIAGLIVASGAILYSIYVLASGLLFGTSSLPPGWATLAIGVSFLGGIQLIGIGMLGEYLGRTLGEVRSRPAYIVRECDFGPGGDAASKTDEVAGDA